MFLRLNRLMTRVAQAIFSHPIKGTIAFAVLVGAVLVNLPQLQPDGRIEAFMRADDPALRAYQEMRKTFGQDNRIIVTASGRDIFDAGFIDKLTRLHREIAAEVPYVAELFSPYNIPFIEYQNGGLYIEDLVRNMLARGQDPGIMRERILATPLYQNFIVSKDGDVAAIIIEPNRYAPHPSDCVAVPAEGISCPDDVATPVERELLGSAQYAEMSRAVHDVVGRYENDRDFVVHVSGAPVVSTEIVRLMSTEMPRFTLMAVVLAVIVMMVMFRSPLIALAALLTFLTSIFTTFGLMALTGRPLTPPTQLLIPLLLIGSLCSFIHFTSSLLRGYKTCGTKLDAIALAIEHSHAPILFAALTTAAGLLGFVFSALAPIATLGIFGAVGSVIAYLAALFYALIVLRLLGPRFFERRYTHYPRVVAWMTGMAMFAQRRRFSVLAALVALIAASGFGLAQLQYSHNSLLWLPADNEVRRSTEFIDSRFSATVNLEVMIHPTNGRDFRDAELMQALDRAASDLPALTDVPIGRQTSIIDFVKETNQALSKDDPAAHVVPGQEAIWDELLLLESEGTDDTQRYVSSTYDVGRLSILTPWLEAKRYTGFIDTVRGHLGERLEGLATVETTGLIALLSVTSAAVLSSMVSSYAIATAQITILMCLSLGRVGLGLLSMVPNILPFVFLLAIMGAAGLPIDTFTVLIGGVLQGLIVDDTIHYFYHYKRNLDRYGDQQAAIKATVEDVGVLMTTTTLVVIGGFSIFLLSSLSNLATFGLLMVLGATLAFLAELFVSPALVSLLGPRRGRALAPTPRPAGALEISYAS